MEHTQREKRLFILKVGCVGEGEIVGPFQKQQKKKRGKLIRDILRRNRGKLIEDGGSNL